MDWVSFLVSAVVGLVSYLILMICIELTALVLYLLYSDDLTITFLFQVAVVGSLESPKADLWVMFAILSAVIGYCAKIYLTLSVLSI